MKIIEGRSHTGEGGEAARSAAVHNYYSIPCDSLTLAYIPSFESPLAATDHGFDGFPLIVRRGALAGNHHNLETTMLLNIKIEHDVPAV
jgi:hypothetical protein